MCMDCLIRRTLADPLDLRLESVDALRSLSFREVLIEGIRLMRRTGLLLRRISTRIRGHSKQPDRRMVRRAALIERSLRRHPASCGIGVRDVAVLGSEPDPNRKAVQLGAL
jgi:hypothetical protein